MHCCAPFIMYGFVVLLTIKIKRMCITDQIWPVGMMTSKIDEEIKTEMSDTSILFMF